MASSEHPDEWTQFETVEGIQHEPQRDKYEETTIGLKMLPKCIKRLSQNVWITCYKVAKDTQ